MSLLTNQEYPQFTREEERHLAEQAVAGDADAREQLILSQIPWAIELIVKRWKTLPAEKDELIAEAMLQLAKAVDEFDPEWDVKLSTWAYWRVLHARSEITRRRKRARPPGSHVPLETIAVEPDEPDLDPQGLDAHFVAWALDLVEERWGFRTRTVCEMRLGTGMTLDKIGGKLGVSKQRAGQLWARSVNLIRETLSEGGVVRIR